MSILNKIGLTKLSAYNDLLSRSSMQQAHIVELKVEILELKNRISRMSDTTILRDELNNLNARYEEMKKGF